MKTFPLLVVLFCPFLLLNANAHEGHEHDPGDGCAAVAYAVPLENITIDGKLDDWPKDMVQYPLLNNWDPYGPNDLSGKSLRDNPDFSGHFMVGYDAKKELLYVAFVVRDDNLVTENDNPKNFGWETDVTELYTDGLHAERHSPWTEREGIARHASIQYVGTVGDGGAYHCRWLNPERHNPWIKDGHPQDMGAAVKAIRENDQIIYEWAIRVYDRFPEHTPLVPGRRIGFDAVMVDMDKHDGKIIDRAAWVPFGKIRPAKFEDASSMADLAFVGDRKELGTIAGSLVVPEGSVKHPFIVLEAWNEMVPAGETATNPDGSFTFVLPAGHYMIRARPGEMIEPFTQELDVKRGKTQKITIHAPEPPTAERFAGNGHLYVKVSQSMDWSGAQQYAQNFQLTYGGQTLTNWHLATITSEEENRFIFETVLGESTKATPAEREEAPYYWLGGIRFDAGLKNYIWVTGEPFVYERLVDTELRPHENALMIGGYTGDRWNDGDGFGTSWHECQQFILEHPAVAESKGNESQPKPAAAKPRIRPNNSPGADLAAPLRLEFFRAAAAGDMEKIGSLLDKEPRLIDSHPDNDHRTPLIIAAWENQVEMTKLLLKRGANIEGEDYVYGGSALGWAAWFGRPKVIEVLFAAGAEINHPNRDGTTPLRGAFGALESKRNFGDNPPTRADREAVIKFLQANGGVAEKQKRTRPWPIIAGWDDIE